MSRPSNRQQAAAAQQAAVAMSGAVDLSALKERADAARSQPQRSATSPAAGGAGAASSATIIDVTEETFESDVLERSLQQLIVVDLWADWSDACQQLSPVLERLAGAAGGRWILAKVNVDANPRIAQAFRAQSIPMVVAIAAGQPVAAFNGVRGESEIADWISEILTQVGGTLTGVPEHEPEPEVDDPRMAAAEELLNRGDLDAAIAAYREIAEAEPANVEAASLVRNLEFMARAQAHDPAIVESAAPDDLDGQLAAADVLLLSQQPEAAFDRIITVVKATSGDERTKARTRLLELFELFDPAEPFVVTARRKLASALF